MADISQIKLPSGDTFDIIDEKSGYIKTSIYHGTSASAAADTTKVVTCEDFTSSDLKAGAAILVTFSTTNSAAVASLALNVNGTGVKNVKYINNGTLGNLSSAGYLKANTTYLFIYDGTYWVAYFNYNTTYSSMSEAEARAGTATTARTVTAARLKDTIDYTLENKTDYSIPVSRVGEIVAGETAIGTDSTNFPTSKAVVDYVDERVVQEMDAIDVGVTGIKANGTSLSIVDGVVNIPAIGPNQTVGLMTDQWMQQIWNGLDSIPQNTSDLYNDSGFITSETDPTVPAWAKASTKPTYTAGEVGALPSNTFIPQVFKVVYYSSTNTADKTYTEIDQAYNRGDLVLLLYNGDIYQTTRASTGYVFTTITDFTSRDGQGNIIKTIKQLKLYTSNTWHITSYQFPSKTSDLTNDSGYLTASDIASVMTYKGTKANYAALPSTGNITGDVWHLTDTGAEWAWDGSAWQELGTAIDVSSFLTSETDPVFTASPAHGIAASDITNWNGKTAVSIVRW